MIPSYQIRIYFDKECNMLWLYSLIISRISWNSSFLNLAHLRRWEILYTPISCKDFAFSIYWIPKNGIGHWTKKQTVLKLIEYWNMIKLIMNIIWFLAFCYIRNCNLVATFEGPRELLPRLWKARFVSSLYMWQQNNIIYTPL